MEEDLRFVARRLIQKAERFLDTATAWDVPHKQLRQRVLHDRLALNEAISLAREVLYPESEK